MRAHIPDITTDIVGADRELSLIARIESAFDAIRMAPIDLDNPLNRARIRMMLRESIYVFDALHRYLFAALLTRAGIPLGPDDTWPPPPAVCEGGRS
jgi:hypothetical protein